MAIRVAAESEQDLTAGGLGRHAGRIYELEGVEAIGGDDIAEALTNALDRTVEYRTAPLADMRAALTGGGLAPYQIDHTISLFSNINAGLLEAERPDHGTAKTR